MVHKQSVFGLMPNGREITKYTLQNSNDISVSVIPYGATLVAVKLPDKNDRVDNVVLGFDSLEGYLGDHPYLGSTVGRYANRIAKGTFKLNGKKYELARNEAGKNHLHGGNIGFDKVVWQAEPFGSSDSAGVTFKYTSADGEEGYPGKLQITVIYSLNEENELIINYKANTDKPTPINLTNHAYWNLAGAGSGKILDHQLELYASEYLPVNDELIPTGEIKKVSGTPLDFTTEKKIGKDIADIGGYDHCYVIDQEEESISKAASVYDPQSGRGMQVLTTKPGIQFYTGNFLDGLRGAKGATYNQHDGFCLETQYYPDSVNQPDFPNVILEPGEVYHHITIHKFFVK